MDRPLNHRFPYETLPGFVVLGVGGTFRVDHPEAPAEAEECRWRYVDHPTWNDSPIRNHRQTDIIYAYPMVSNLVRHNRRQAEFHNPQLLANPQWLSMFPAQPATPAPWMTQEIPDEEDEEEVQREWEDAETEREGLEQVVTEDEIALTQDPAIISEPIFAMPSGVRLFCITFNAAPVGTLEELLELIRPLISSEVTANSGRALSEELWRLQWNANPEAALDRWMETEPVAVACLDYVRLPQAEGVALVEVPSDMAATTAMPVAGLIVRAAAGALLSGGLGNHFTFTENGGIIINPDNPPSLEQSYEMMRRSIGIEETAERLRNFSRWTVGGLVDGLERLHGDAFDITAVCESTNRTYNTIRCCVNVFQRWYHRRHDNLSYTHYREIEFLTASDEDKSWLADQSSRMNLTVAQQRRLASHIRVYGRAGIEENMPLDRDELIERLEVRSTNRNFMFMLQGAWYQYRGPFQHIPNGATQIINADTREILDREGNPRVPETWEPVGIEIPFVRGHVATIDNNIEQARQTGEIPRRSHGGRHARIAQGDGANVTITPEVAQEAAVEADNILQEERPSVLTGAMLDETYDRMVGAMREYELNEIQAELQEHVDEATNERMRTAVQAVAPHGEVTRQSCEAVRFEEFYGEEGAERLLNMTGYPRGMPDYIREMLDLARTEANAPETLGPMHQPGSYLRRYREFADDHIVPF